MSKQGMKRPEITQNKEKNDIPPVPELQGKAKHTKEKAGPITQGTKPKETRKTGRSSDPYSIFDNDVATENLENDLSAADKQDL